VQPVRGRLAGGPAPLTLLKNPLCVGEAQEVILKELGRRTGRRFAGVWDFVEWAEQHAPSLDLASPFQRPQGLDG